MTQANAPNTCRGVLLVLPEREDSLDLGYG